MTTPPPGSREAAQALDEIEAICREQDGYASDNSFQRIAALTATLRAALAPPADVAGAFNMEAHLERQRAWSRETFGMLQRPAGVIDHIRKELLEIEADPTDLEEWVDVIILAFDGAWRAGWEPPDILKAIVAKQTKNESRVWPDWRTADPDKAVEHIRSHVPATHKDTQDD